MTILLTLHDSHRLLGRCDAQCYNATNAACSCICGGANHGIGRTKAAQNTLRNSREIVKRFRQNHPELGTLIATPAADIIDLAQKPLFSDDPHDDLDQ